MVVSPVCFYDRTINNNRWHIFLVHHLHSGLSSLCLLPFIVFNIIIFKYIHAVTVRRFQDSNMNGNWTALRKIPIVGYINSHAMPKG